MKFKEKNPPRVFNGAGNKISDFGDIELDPLDQVTFVTKSGRKSDFTAMSWGFYLTNSLNGRLKEQGFKTALVRNKAGRLYLNLVEKDKIKDFEEYLSKQDSVLLEWLDERQ